MSRESVPVHRPAVDEFHKAHCRIVSKNRDDPPLDALAELDGLFAEIEPPFTARGFPFYAKRAEASLYVGFFLYVREDEQAADHLARARDESLLIWNEYLEDEPLPHRNARAKSVLTTARAASFSNVLLEASVKDGYVPWVESERFPASTVSHYANRYGLDPSVRTMIEHAVRFGERAGFSHWATYRQLADLASASREASSRP